MTTPLHKKNDMISNHGLSAIKAGKFLLASEEVLYLYFSSTHILFFSTFLFLQKWQAAEELALSWNLTNVLYVLKVLIKSSACRTT